MSNYRWSDHLNQPLGARYLPTTPGSAVPRDVAGLGEWERFANLYPFLSPEDAWDWLRQIHRAPPPIKVRKCPRIFVSHRWVDADHALRIAWLAHQSGFEYWLDVIDIPPSMRLPPTPLAFNSTLLIASLIEMALINCTHVIAVMTRDTAPSRWVPYEYGRIKDDPPGDRTAACWHDTMSLPDGDLPEYLRLAPVLTNESAIRQWLSHELLHFTRCQRVGMEDWTGSVPEPLPEADHV